MAGLPRKEAIVCILDVGRSMGTVSGEYKGSGETRRRIDLAKEAIKYFMLGKMLKSKENEVGVVLFGTEESQNQLNEDVGGYENITELVQLGPPKLADVKAILDVEPTELEGDMVSGFIIAINMLWERTKKKRYQRFIYLFTDAEWQIEGAEDLTQAVNKACEKDMQAQINVVGLDFSAPPPPNVKPDPDQMEEESYKAQNEKFLHQLVPVTKDMNETPGQVYQVLDFLNFYHKPRKGVKPTMYNITVEFTSLIKVRAKFYSKVMTSRLPPLKKKYEDPEGGTSGTGKLEIGRTYFDPEDENNEEVKLAQRTKGYSYGGDFVPVGPSDLPQMKLADSEVALKILFFIPKGTVPPYHFLGNTVAVLGSPDDDSHCQALWALVQALEATSQYAVARFKRNKTADPVMGVLIPEMSDTKTYFLFNQLPFAEDFRSYLFPSFDKSPNPRYRVSKEQQQVADNLVDALMIPSKSDGTIIRPVVNPSIFRANKYTIQKALDESYTVKDLFEDDEDKSVLAPFQQDPELFKGAEKVLEAFKAAFPLKRAETNIKKEKRYWHVANEPAEGHAVTRSEIRTTDKEEQPKPSLQRISTTKPVEDFKEMLRSDAEQAISSAIDQMKSIITDLVDTGEEPYYRKALSCLEELRAGCVTHFEGAEFNTFISDIIKRKYEEGKHRKFWDMVVEKKVGLITKESDATLQVDQEDVKKFFAPTEEKQHMEVEGPAEVEEEDLFSQL